MKLVNKFKNNIYYYLTIILISILVILNCRGFLYLLPSGIQVLSIHIYKIITIFSLMTFVIEYRCLLSWTYIKTYFAFYVVFFFLPEFLLSILKYDQSFGVLLLGFDGYFAIVWMFTYIYILKEDTDNICNLLDIISNILAIGYIILIINIYMKEKMDISLFNVSKWDICRGHIRITDTSSFFGIVICYLWSQIINRKNVFSNLFKMIFVLGGFAYVDRTRMPLYSVIICIILMTLIFHKNNIMKLVCWIVAIATIVFVFWGDIHRMFLQQFSVKNNGISTIARLNEVKYYFSAFLDNPVYGLGIAEQGVFFRTLGIDLIAHNNYEDIGILGLLGVIGIMGLIFLFVVPIVRWIYVATHSKEFLIEENIYEFVVGIIFYVIITSITYTIVNYQRIPALPLLIAFFEVVYYRSRKR